MKCPVDKTDTLSPISLIANLPARQCPTCSGIWLGSNGLFAFFRLNAPCKA